VHEGCVVWVQWVSAAADWYVLIDDGVCRVGGAAGAGWAWAAWGVVAGESVLGVGVEGAAA